MTAETAEDRSAVARVWKAMRHRCEALNDPAFVNYGERGIFVCTRWHDFDQFVADMGPRPIGGTIERIDNDGPYSPNNCRWATRKEQSRNTRCNVFIKIDGRRMVLEDWAAELDIPARTLGRRILKGIAPEAAVAMGKGRCRRGYSAPEQSAARVARCIRGHSLDGSNVAPRRDGARVCKTCRAENNRNWRARIK